MILNEPLTGKAKKVDDILNMPDSNYEKIRAIFGVYAPTAINLNKTIRVLSTELMNTQNEIKRLKLENENGK